ncbi:hypothetical protein EV426DRAFT_579156 [Tirmania nivea]|nr:hypothetical protein EV426DRAFT_579156 [Tirmania nivea]
MALEDGAAGRNQDYAARFAALIQTDNSKFALIKDLTEDNERLSQKMSKLELQLEDERETKEKWRARYLEIAKETEKAFTETYLLHTHGGQNAATELLQAARNTLRMSGLFGATESFEVVVRAFANVDGVADVLRSRGLQSDFRKFAVGFSQPRSLVDFVDVGRGKEMADAKIAGEIRFHLSNHSCKQVILGVSHDNGYARVLSSILADGENPTRITLLEGVPFGKEFNNLPFSRITWSNLFLSKKLESWVPYSIVQQPAQRHHQQQQRQQTGKERAKSGGRDTTSQPFQIHITPGPPHGHNIPPPPPYENRPNFESKRGLSYPPSVPRPPAALLLRIQLGLKSTAPCWNHYLGQGCSTPNQCRRSHIRVFTADEMDALKYMAQGHRCLQGIKCKNPSCYYGHRCQELDVCNGQGCAFLPEEHEQGKYRPAQQLHVQQKGSGAGRSASPVSTNSALGKHKKSHNAGVKGAVGPNPKTGL